MPSVSSLGAPAVASAPQRRSRQVDHAEETYVCGKCTFAHLEAMLDQDTPPPQLVMHMPCMCLTGLGEAAHRAQVLCRSCSCDLHMCCPRHVCRMMLTALVV